MDKDFLESGRFRAKEISWLSFNSRVLEEAEDPTVPLMERMRFLGIYSSNLDEFFRVRVATLLRLTRLSKEVKSLNIPDPTDTLFEVHEILVKETARFNQAYDKVLEALEKKGIEVVDELSVPIAQRDHLMDYFQSKVRPHLMPILLKGRSDLSDLNDHPMYLAVVMRKKSGRGRPGHALIEIPSDILPRFHVLPQIKKKKGRQVIYLDDVIRFGLASVFESLPFDDFDAYAIKFTRDSELAFDDDFTESILDRMSEGLRARLMGSPVRMNYDEKIPEPFLKLLRRKLNFSQLDSLYPGARYHNRKGLIGFPALGRDDLCWKPLKPVPHPRLDGKKRGLFKALQRHDALLHLPYHSFDRFLDFLREAAMDPLVRAISLTQYRAARDSCVAAALMAAVRNGKHVTVFVEPQARFDEEANLVWAARYREAGLKVIMGLPGLKVHAKLCLVERSEGGRMRTYCAVGTGNFNESTAKIYTDHLLMTADVEIGKDLERCFEYLASPAREPKLTKLVASPFGLRKLLEEGIAREIELAKKGEKGEVFIKLNNLSDPETVELLDRAALAGVRVRLIVRGMYSVVADRKVRKNLKAIGIVDRYLEHSRVFVFGNGGKPLYYLSSADLLPRNLDSRFEIVCPVEDKKLQDQLEHYLQLQWKDEVKARELDKKLSNPPRKSGKKARATRAQETIRDWLAGR